MDSSSYSTWSALIWCYLDAWCPPKLLYYSPPKLDRENIGKGSRVKDWDSLTGYNHGQSRISLGILMEFIAYKIRAGWWQVKQILKTPFPHPSLLRSSISSHPVLQENRLWRIWSVHHMLFPPLLGGRNLSP